MVLEDTIWLFEVLFVAGRLPLSVAGRRPGTSPQVTGPNSVSLFLRTGYSLPDYSALFRRSLSPTVDGGKVKGSLNNEVRMPADTNRRLRIVDGQLF